MLTQRDIKSLSHEELYFVLTQELKLPKFRVGQLEQWIWEKGASSFDQVTSFSKALRAQLAEQFTLSVPTIALRQESADGTRKYLMEYPDGTNVETVGIPSHDGSRLTVCFSTQAGCAMGCTFCATGWGGFNRNLNAGEMYDQVRLVGEDFGTRVTNVVAMGQGEPFANYDAVLLALERMNNKQGLEIGARHITVSTCGIIKGIERFSRETQQYTLAVSLHSAIQETRDKIMPGVSKQPLPQLRKVLKDYGESTKRRPTLEYALMDQVNDDSAHLDALIAFCRGMLCHVNLIPLNPIKKDPEQDQQYLMEPSQYIRMFEQALSKAGIEVSIRNSRGSDIDGACGQLLQAKKINYN